MDSFNLKEYDWKIFLHPKKLFLENLGLKQTLVKNTFWLALAEGITKLLKFFLFVYIARILGATEYGKFSFALSFASMFIIFSDLGIFQIITRELSKSREKEKDFPALISFKIILDLLSFVMIFIGSFFITHETLIRIIILIIGAQVLLNNFLNFFYAFFRARQKMEYQAWIQIVQAILVTGFGFFILFMMPSAENLSWAYLLGTIISLALIAVFFHFKILSLKLSFKPGLWKEYLKISYPLALAALLGSIHSNIDSTIMGSSNQIAQTGWYNAAQGIVQASFVFISFLGISFFPVLSKFYHQENKENFQKAVGYFFISSFFIIIPIIAGGIILAPKIINFIYNSSYSPSVFAFQILLLAIGISSLSRPFNQSLVISNHQGKVFWITLFAAITNIVFNLILIPKLSLYGASFSALISMTLSFFLALGLSLKYAEVKIFNSVLWKNIVIIVLSSGLMALVISQGQIFKLYIIWPFLIGIFVYVFAFLIFKIFWEYAIKSN